ncbi:DUF1656 domain-containing protein [Sphingobium aquiterrae]|uniref:DUF1656 domain-containing protein n=1 Tax=Sphingobium aquiterrae TaxID=2038656 RepID=UPI00301766B1
MIGEIALGGVFVPTLLLLGGVATVLSFLLMRLLAYFGLYRFLAYRALVDVSLYVLVLGLLVLLVPLVDIHL